MTYSVRSGTWSATYLWWMLLSSRIGGTFRWIAFCWIFACIKTDICACVYILFCLSTHFRFNYHFRLCDCLLISWDKWTASSDWFSINQCAYYKGLFCLKNVSEYQKHFFVSWLTTVWGLIQARSQIEAGIFAALFLGLRGAQTGLVRGSGAGINKCSSRTLYLYSLLIM